MSVSPEQGDQRVRLLLLVGVVASLGLLGGPSVLVVVSSFVCMLAFHEFGHFVVARLTGMQVTEFFVGFGPRLWSIRRGETEYGVKAVPAGAYVRITGMTNLEKVDPALEHRTYRFQSYPRRMAVSLAGSATHFLVAIVLLVVLLGMVGIPDPEVWQVGEVVSGSTADEMGVLPGDRIVSVAGVETPRFDTFGVVVRAVPGHDVSVVIERDGERFERTGVIGERLTQAGAMSGFFGVGAEYPLATVGPFRAVTGAVGRFGDLVALSVEGLVRFFTPGGLAGFVGGAVDGGGPGAGSAEVPSVAPDADDGARMLSLYGVVRLGGFALEEGIANFLWFLVLVNVFVGVFNLVPLLPLDGGHVAIATYERIRSRGGRRYTADAAKLAPLTWAVLFLLIGVALVALYRDIVDLPDFG